MPKLVDLCNLWIKRGELSITSFKNGRFERILCIGSLMNKCLLAEPYGQDRAKGWMLKKFFGNE